MTDKMKICKKYSVRYCLSTCLFGEGKLNREIKKANNCPYLLEEKAVKAQKKGKKTKQKNERVLAE